MVLFPLSCFISYWPLTFKVTHEHSWRSQHFERCVRTSGLFFVQYLSPQRQLPLPPLKKKKALYMQKTRQEIFHPFIGSLPKHPQDKTRSPKVNPGLPHRGQVPSPWALICWFSGCVLAGSWVRQQALGLEPRYADLGCGPPPWHLHCATHRCLDASLATSWSLSAASLTSLLPHTWARGSLLPSVPTQNTFHAAPHVYTQESDVNWSTMLRQVLFRAESYRMLWLPFSSCTTLCVPWITTM